MSMPRMSSARATASCGVSASFTPPALPRPPALTWALTTTRPPCSSAAAAASSAFSTTVPTVTGTPCLAKSSFAWYSIRSTVLTVLFRVTAPDTRARFCPGRVTADISPARRSATTAGSVPFVTCRPPPTLLRVRSGEVTSRSTSTAPPARTADRGAGARLPRPAGHLGRPGRPAPPRRLARRHVRRPGRRRSDAPPRRADYRSERPRRRPGRGARRGPARRGRCHLVGHDWGSVQLWDAVAAESTDPRLRGRIASFTSVSGPSLDHAARLVRARAARRSGGAAPAAALRVHRAVLPAPGAGADLAAGTRPAARALLTRREGLPPALGPRAAPQRGHGLGALPRQRAAAPAPAGRRCTPTCRCWSSTRPATRS